MSRRWSPIGRYVLTGIVGLVACSFPTAVCGCSPSRSTVYVRGTVSDAGGAPVAGARLYLDGVPAERAADYPVYVSGPGDAQTDAGGAFGALVYSVYSPGTLSLRVALVRAGGADTVRLAAGTAQFRNQRESADTVVVALHLP